MKSERKKQRKGAGARLRLQDLADYRVLALAMDAMPLSTLLHDLVWNVGRRIATAQAGELKEERLLTRIRRDAKLVAICKAIAAREDRPMATTEVQSIWLPFTDEERKVLQSMAQLLGWNEGGLIGKCLRDATVLGAASLPLLEPPSVASRYRALQGSLRRAETELLSELNQSLAKADQERAHRREGTTLGVPSKGSANKMRFSLGRSSRGEAVMVDMESSEFCHGILMGGPGSGKTEMLRAIASDLVAQNDSSSLRLVLIDPKGISFNLAAGSPYLACPVLQTASDAVNQLKLLVHNISAKAYKGETRYVVIIDDYHELISEDHRKEVLEGLLHKLAASGRRAGVHLLLSVQRVDRRISKSLFTQMPLRIYLKMKFDELPKEMRGEVAVEQLAGKGEFLTRLGESFVRAQSYFIGDRQMERLFGVALS